MCRECSMKLLSGAWWNHLMSQGRSVSCGCSNNQRGFWISFFSRCEKLCRASAPFYYYSFRALLPGFIAQTHWLHGQKYQHLNIQYVIVEHLIPKPWAIICCYNSLHSSGFRLSNRCWNLLNHKSLSEVQHWCWWWSGLAHSRHSSSSQMCWMEFRSRLCEGQSSYAAPNWKIISL